MEESKLQVIQQLEKTLVYLIQENMSLEQKLKALADAHWCAWNTGYCDAMANKLWGGGEDAQTRKWELDCKYKWEVDRLYALLSELKQE